MRTTRGRRRRRPAAARDEVAWWLCNLILTRVASPEYRDEVGGMILYGLAAAARDEAAADLRRTPLNAKRERPASRAGMTPEHGRRGASQGPGPRLAGSGYYAAGGTGAGTAAAAGTVFGTR